MAKPLFYVDLSEDARDYRHTALEPGLPLLDRQGVNFQILRKWLGEYVAEPEWRDQDTVAFYLVDEERGRLEDGEGYPATQADLTKDNRFAKDLEAIQAKVKKIKPQSSTEQMVHRVLKKSLAEQTADLDNSDFDSFFFRCRAGKESWRLVWCCGYQRADLEPLRAKVWNTPSGEYLAVRPPLQGGRIRKRKRTGPLDVLTSPWLVLALLLLVAAFLYASWPRLEITPAEWSGPLGSQIEYRLEDRRWFFFRDDVTRRALPQSNDPRVVAFDRGGVAQTKSTGSTFVSFRLGNRIIDARVDVGPPKAPDSLTIEPDDLRPLAVGSTRRLRAIGHYGDDQTVDLTRSVEWWEDGESRLLIVSDEQRGRIQGESSGETRVVAQFPVPREDQTFVQASRDVQVVLADFDSLAVELDPPQFAVGQHSQVNVVGIDRQGERHDLTGSSLLRLQVDPAQVARLDGDYLVGRQQGAGEVQARYGDWESSLAFNISGRAVGEDVFDVTPRRVENAVVYELVPLNVTTGSDLPIQAESSNPEVVEVFRTEDENVGYEVWLAARRAGEAQVRVFQGDRSQMVQVVVTSGLIDDLEFEPPIYTLRMGESRNLNLTGTTQEGRVIQVAPDALVWERQPRFENVDLDKQRLRVRGLEATDVPQPLRVALGRRALTASATVEVREGDMLALLESENGFGAHPPVPARGRYIPVGGDIGDRVLRYDSDRGLTLSADVDPFSPLGLIPRGSQIVEVNGVRLDEMSPDELTAFFRRRRFGEGDVVRYRGRDGALGTHVIGGRLGVVRDFRLLDVLSSNVTDDSFDAELRLYLRLAGEYRLTHADGEPLSEWAAYPQDATPLIAVPGLTRQPGDDYELYVERRIDDRVRRFQVPFTLAPERTEAVYREGGERQTVRREPAEPAVRVDREADGQRVRTKKTTRTIRRPASGDSSAVFDADGNLVSAEGNPYGPGAGSPPPGAPPADAPPSGSPPADGSPSPEATAAAPPSDGSGQPGPDDPPPPRPAEAPEDPAGEQPPSAYPADVAAGPAEAVPQEGSPTPAAETRAPAPAAGRTTGSSSTPPAGRAARDESRASGSRFLDALRDFNQRDR